MVLNKKQYGSPSSIAALIALLSSDALPKGWPVKLTDPVEVAGDGGGGSEAPPAPAAAAPVSPQPPVPVAMVSGHARDGRPMHACR